MRLKIRSIWIAVHFLVKLWKTSSNMHFILESDAVDYDRCNSFSGVHLRLW